MSNMVSLVIVSHSAQLATGVRELAYQVAQGRVEIAIAGGIDDPEHPIGTDAMKVLEAINSVSDEHGILVLMDLGSALLSAETALDFLDPDRREKVRLCAAPLVEGTVAAAVQASVGASLDDVFNEAIGALGPKLKHMAHAEEQRQETGATTSAGGLQLRLIIPNRLGLHARPAARFVSTANNFQAGIEVRKGQKQANAKSINQVATLGAQQGDEIIVSASGPDAEQALLAIQALADDNFGDKEDEDVVAPIVESVVEAAEDVLPEQEAKFLRGIAASPGVAIAPLVHYRQQLPPVEVAKVEDPQAEWQQLQDAIRAALDEISALRQQMSRQGNEAEAQIFSAHELILQDPSLLDKVRLTIEVQALSAPATWQSEIERLADEYRAIEDEYMRARVNDVLDVGRRVLSHLLQLEPASLQLESPAIVAARDLAPSDTAQFDPQLVLGVCTELGGATSHSAILARALGIPAIVGLGPALARIPDRQLIAIDGEMGTVWLQPDEETVGELQQRRQRFLDLQYEARRSAQTPAITVDGQRIEVAANIGGPQDVALALEMGAEGVGLFRTEFLFLNRPDAPSEAEQYAAYRQVAQAMGQRPVIIRTLDVGGDKRLPYLDLGFEENPFLGWRGIRFCLDHPEVFVPQLRAILSAGYEHNVSLMLPMVSTVAEVSAAKSYLEQAQRELRQEERSFDDNMQVGIMIEVPGAVAIADQLAQEVDFFSIGTNDLTQYVMAADRGNRRVSALADALQPAVLRMIAQTVEAGQRAGIWVGMCGELAGNTLATRLLVGLGLDELSMNAPSIPQVKERIRKIDLANARPEARELLKLHSAAAVSQRLR